MVHIKKKNLRKKRKVDRAFCTERTYGKALYTGRNKGVSVFSSPECGGRAAGRRLPEGSMNNHLRYIYQSSC